jgi:hypothetical protein
MKVLTAIKDRVTLISRTWIRFPLVFILLFAIAVCVSLSTATGSDYTRPIFALILGVFLSAVMTMGFEKRKRHVMWFLVSQGIVLILAAVYYLFALSGKSGGVIDGLRILILCFALLFLFLWIPCIRWKTDFNDLFMTFIKAVFTTGFFTGIIWGGITLVLGAVDSLLFQLPSNLYTHTATWIWIFFAPMLLLSLLPVFSETEADRTRKEHLAKIPAFFRILLSYVLIPLTTLYTVVLLAYLIKTLFGGDQRDLLRPMILAYCIVVIALYVLVSGIDNKFAGLFRMLAPKLMLLIALYQVIRLICLIPGEGIVYERYFVILFGIYSVTAGILMSVLPVKKNVILTIVLTGFAIVSVTPPIDAFSVSTDSQLGMMNHVLTANSMLKDGKIVPDSNLSEKDKETVINAMQYLYNMDELGQVSGVSDTFNYYSDFEKTFGFAPYAAADAVETNSVNLVRDTAVPVEIGSYEYMVSAQGGSGQTDKQGTIVSTITDHGKEYTVVLVSGSEPYDLEIKDGNSRVILTVSLSDFIDQMEPYANADNKQAVSSDKMTFDVTADNVSLRVVFSYADKYENGSQATYDSGMILLLRFN